MYILLFSYFYEVGIRYSLNEQIFDKFLNYAFTDYSASITPYIANTYLGSLSFKWRDILFGVKYFDVGNMELRDEGGNITANDRFTFMGFYFIKGFVKFNVYYQFYERNNMTLTQGFIKSFKWKNYTIYITADDIGFSTPYFLGVSLNSKSFSFSLGYEDSFGFIYNLVLWKSLGKSFKIYMFKTNRYREFSLNESILNGLGMAMVLERRNLKVAYLVRNMGDMGFIHTVGLFR